MRVSDERLVKLLDSDRENLEWSAHGLALDLRDCRAERDRLRAQVAALREAATRLLGGDWFKWVLTEEWAQPDSRDKQVETLRATVAATAASAGGAVNENGEKP